MKCADCENEVDIEASDVCSACEETRLVAARDHEIVALKRIIENGRAAHNEDRIARDWLVRDRDEWKARANKFEAQVEMLETRAEADILNAEAAIARATQAEAQAAAMLQALDRIEDRVCETSGYGAGCTMRCVRIAEVAVAEHGKAGRTLLAELEALRALEVAVRKLDDAHISLPSTTHYTLPVSVRLSWELHAMLAAVDASRKGET